MGTGIRRLDVGSREPLETIGGAVHVTVRFLDGEVIEGDSDAATLSEMGFPVTVDRGNTQVAWISLASIKYVLFNDSREDGADHDPRADQDLTKIVLHFVDGEILRTYKDDQFSQESEGFMLRLWDPATKGLIRALVSLHALKAIFFVNQWDSRSDEERVRYSPIPPTPPVEGLSEFVEKAPSSPAPRSKSGENPKP
jgi:hypothetical protein